MSFINKFMAVTPGVAGPVSLTSVADVQFFALPYQMSINRVEALVTTAVVSSAPVQLSVFARPTHGSATGQVLLGVLNIPAGTAVGKCVYKDLSDKLVSVQAGQELVFSVTVAAAGGGAAGAVIPMAQMDEAPEVALNQSNLVLSA